MKFLFPDGTPVVHGSLDGPTPTQSRKQLLAAMKPKRKPIVRSKTVPLGTSRSKARSSPTKMSPKGQHAEPVTAFDDRSRPQLLGDLARRLA